MGGGEKPPTRSIQASGIRRNVDDSSPHDPDDVFLGSGGKNPEKIGVPANFASDPSIFQ